MTVHTSPGFVIFLFVLTLIIFGGIAVAYLIYDIVTGIRSVISRRESKR